MERNENFGMEYEDARMEWNGIEDFKNGMEDNFPYFHTNSILIDFTYRIYRKICANSDKEKFVEAFCN